jgi:acyl-CoA thioester hydrolase
MSNRFSLTFTAMPEHIDANGHVNNAVWVRWMEELAVAHWMHDARPADAEAFVWVVTRHEIDYRGNVGEGAVVTGETLILEGPRGARFDRHFSFTDAEGKQLVRAKTTWAMVDKASGRLLRVPPEVAAPFAPQGGWQ